MDRKITPSFASHVGGRPHFSGADVENLLSKRFPTYDDAQAFADDFATVCMPTIYAIVDNEYAFLCERAALENKPFRIYSITSIDGGQVVISIWWEKFKENPKKFLSLGKRIP